MPLVPRIHPERADELVLLHVAEPAPLGLFSLSIGCMLLFSVDFEWTEGKVMLIPYILAIPGTAQIIAGLMDYGRNNVFGATAFTGYGFFWIALGSMYSIEMQYNAEELKDVCYNPIRQHTGVVCIGYLIFSLGLTVLALATHRFLLFALVSIDFAFFFLIMHIYEKWTSKLLGVGLVGVCSGGLYGFVGVLAAKMAGGEIIPLGKPFINLSDYIIRDYEASMSSLIVPDMETIRAENAPKEEEEEDGGRGLHGTYSPDHTLGTEADDEISSVSSSAKVVVQRPTASSSDEEDTTALLSAEQPEAAVIEVNDAALIEDN